MSFLRTIFSIFSPYAHPLEKTIASFFKGIGSYNSREAQQRTLGLMQRNLVIFHLWMEYRHKGYKYLNKNTRKTLYENLKKLENLLEQFCAKNTSLPTPKIEDKSEKTTAELTYLAKIMAFFQSPKIKYLYRESSNFGSLLRDPEKAELVGDCNQIVTLYIYLFSRKYDINHLQLKIFENHVCLHFQGIDLEATSHSFTHYHKKDQQILPIIELIPINLLDVTDREVQTFEVSPKFLVEAYKLAAAISKEKKLIYQNLKAAYHQLVHQTQEAHNYDLALQYAKQNEEASLIKNVAHNAVVYFTKQHSFHKAKKYLTIADDPELKKYCLTAEAADLYEKKKYEAAASIFKSINDQEKYQLCYKALFFQEQEKIKGIKTVAELKQKKYVLKKMEDLAMTAKDKKLVEYVKELLKQGGF